MVAAVSDTGNVSTRADRREVVELARQLGHTNLAVIESGHGNTWSSVCACGWRSRRNYAIPGGAVQEAQAHLYAVASRARRDGVSLPATTA